MPEHEFTDSVTTDLNFLSLHPFIRETVCDKIRGTIVGSALGDCIGLYTEFLPSKIAHNAYPEGRFQLIDPVTEFRNDTHRNKFETRSWTDDTDHALLILLSYLHHDGKVLSAKDIAERLRIWVEQGLRALNRPPCGLGQTVGAVVLDKEYLDDPTATAHKHWVKSGRYIAPNGSLMRTHPLGIICVGYSIEETFQIATSFSIITHADPRCIVSCCIATGLIRGMLRGEILNEHDVDDLIERAYRWTDAWVLNERAEDVKSNPDNDDVHKFYFGNGELLNRPEFENHARAQSFKELQLDDSMKMGYVYKCLGVAILSLRMAMRQVPYDAIAAGVTVEASPSATFEKIITEITFAAGDADTNACAAGALLGCWFGYKALPSYWRDGMRDLDWLVQKCNGLLQILQVTRGPGSGYKGSDDLDTRPDGGKGLMSKKELEQRNSAFMMRCMTRYSEGVQQEEEKLRQEKKQKQHGWKGIFK